MYLFSKLRTGRALFFLFPFISSAMGLQAQTYCWPNVQMACFYGDKITRVAFAGMDHTDNVCSTDAHGKKDFTGSVTPGTVTVGQTYTLSVSVENNLSSGTERMRAWIDYNKNGVFESAESINVGTATGNATLNVNVTIPEDAAPGITRMRIMYRRTQTNPLNATDACHSYGSYRGQVKDYALQVEYPSPLPVELLAFTLQNSTEGVQLAWETASETNNDFYTVHHSPDAWHWESLATLPGAGNSNATLRYAYTHTVAHEGIHYYRLQQTDFDGKTKYYPIKSIAVEGCNQSILYPNPCTDFIQLRTEVSAPQFVLYSPSGQALPVAAISNHNNEWTIDTRSLAPGIYFMSLEEQGRTQYIRFVKQ